MRVLTVALLLISTTCFAGFGGSRGGGYSSSRSFSSSYSRPSYSAPARSSSFGGSRANMSRPVTISRPSSSGSSVGSSSGSNHTTTVIHTGGGYGGSNFLTNMMLFNMMTRPQPMMVAGPNGVMTEQMVQAPPSFFDYALGIVLLICFGSLLFVFIALIYNAWKDSRRYI